MSTSSPDARLTLYLSKSIGQRQPYSSLVTRELVEMMIPPCTRTVIVKRGVLAQQHKDIW